MKLFKLLKIINPVRYVVIYSPYMKILYSGICSDVPLKFYNCKVERIVPSNNKISVMNYFVLYEHFEIFLRD